MRVLFVNQYFPPDAAATAYLLGELAEDLAQRHEVWVVSGRPSYNPEATTFRPAGVHLVRAPSTGFSRWHMVGRVANYLSFLVGATVRTQMVPRPDVVVALTDPPIIGVAGLLAALRFRVPFVYVCEDIFPDVAVALHTMGNPVAMRVWRALNRLLRSRAAMVVAIGRDMVEKLEQEGVPADRIALIPNWADEPVLDPARVAAVREARGWTDWFVVMHAGNQGLAQNLTTLLECMDLLRDMPNVRLAFVGDGAALRGLEADASHRGLPNVEFLPYSAKTEVQETLAAADLHVVSLAWGLRGSVVPSKTYGIMSIGRPFVAAVEEGSEVARIVQETGAGVRVDPGDSSGIARAVRDFAREPSRSADAGRRGLEAFRARFRRSLATESYRTLLEDVVRRHTQEGSPPPPGQKKPSEAKDLGRSAD
jgi:colanic acid biosynthesis glycosyl transferase WcaI